MMNYEPKDELAKLLLRLTQLAAGHDPLGFKDINLDAALKHADLLSEFLHNEYVMDKDTSPARRSLGGGVGGKQ